LRVVEALCFNTSIDCGLKPSIKYEHFHFKCAKADKLFEIAL